MDSLLDRMGHHSHARIAVITVLAGFLGGMAANCLLSPPSAQAVTPYMPGSTLEASQPTAAVVNVPAGGIQYRTPEGRMVARVAVDEQGGRYEVFNRDGVMVARLSATANLGGNLTLYNRNGHPIFSASGE